MTKKELESRQGASIDDSLQLYCNVQHLRLQIVASNNVADGPQCWCLNRCISMATMLKWLRYTRVG